MLTTTSLERVARRGRTGELGGRRLVLAALASSRLDAHPVAPRWLAEFGPMACAQRGSIRKKAVEVHSDYSKENQPNLVHLKNLAVVQTANF